MYCFFENHEIPYNLRCGSEVKLPGTYNKIRSKYARFQRCNFMKYNEKNIKFPKTPEFKRRLRSP